MYDRVSQTGVERVRVPAGFIRVPGVFVLKMMRLHSSTARE